MLKAGVYIHDGFTFEPQAECPYYWGTDEYERFLDWLRYVGVEIVEYCQQMGWYRYPVLPQELDRLRVRQGLVAAAHRRGLEFWLILPTNVYSRLPIDQVPPGQLDLREAGFTQCPQEGDGFARTAEIGRYFARCFQGADAFEVFAGDWGGCRCGRCTIDQYVRYVNFHTGQLAGEQPQARVWANLWSISSWQGLEHALPRGLDDVTWRQFWDDEITLSQHFLRQLHQIPARVGIVFPLHHWYRGFCQRWYGEHELPVWPDANLLHDLHCGGRPLVAWTHFIVENDPYHGQLWGTLNVRLRYLRQLCGLIAHTPIETIMGNVYSGRQALNLYAFTRFAHQPDLAIETVIANFVSEVARPGATSLLEDLLIYLENHDPWESDLPPYRRLPPLHENGIRREVLARALPGLPDHLRPDTPLLLNGPHHFARTLIDAFALS